MSTLKVDTILKRTGTGTITVGQSGDTIDFPTGTTISGSGANTPAFEAHLSANQSIANTTYTKIQFNSETYDSNSAYDNSTNYRFTPAVSGKYLIYASTRASTTTDFNNFQIIVRKNGSDVFLQTNRNTHNDSINLIATFDANTTDYFEIFGYQDSGGSINFQGTSSDSPTRFGAYRIVGV